MRARKPTDVRACGPYRTSERPERAEWKRFEPETLFEALIVLGCGLVVLVCGLLSEHAVGPLATLGLTLVGAVVWDFYRQSSRPRP